MKKNKIVLFLALLMLGASVVPAYYWHKHSNDRFPSSIDDADIEAEMDEGKYATPINYLENQDMPERDPAIDDEKEMQAHLDFLKNHQEIVKKEEVAATCNPQQESLEDKVEKLLADKEELLKEIALLKEKKAPKKSDKSDDHKEEKVIAKKDNNVESTTALMMAQLSQAMTSQQMLMQSQMQLMMMIQQQQQEQSPQSMYSKFAFDYYAFDAQERMYQRLAQYSGRSQNSFGNIGGGIGIGYGSEGSQLGIFSASAQDVKPLQVNPMSNYPYIVQPAVYGGHSQGSFGNYSPMSYPQASYGYMPNESANSFDFSNSSMGSTLQRQQF